MKYFTPEWYNDSIVSEICFQLRKTQKAAVFSEKFFEKLYFIEKKAFLKHCKRAAKFEHTKYDVNISSEQFDSNYKENLEFIKTNLPENILSKVADIRVLALGSVTFELFDEITRYCGSLNRKCQKAEERYEDELEAVAEKTGWYKVNFFEYISNSNVISFESNDTSYVLMTSDEYSKINTKITFKDTEIYQNDPDILSSSVVKYELTLSDDNKIVFSLLCSNTDSELCSLSLCASEIDVEEI